MLTGIAPSSSFSVSLSLHLRLHLCLQTRLSLPFHSPLSINLYFYFQILLSVGLFHVVGQMALAPGCSMFMMFLGLRPFLSQSSNDNL